MPHAERDGATISYEDRGDGDAGTVLLIHGGLHDPMNGERFWIAPGVVDDLVAAGYRALVPDRRYGSGNTVADFLTHTWDIEAGDFAAVLADAGVERAHVIAGSNGCSAIARFALNHPDLVASLVLGWPASPDNTILLDAFERSAVAVASDGPEVYLSNLRASGLLRPNEQRPGFPYGVALLRDDRLANSFLALTATDAAHVFRETARALLPGDPIRGMTSEQATRLGQLGIPIFIIPADPEDPFHTRAAAEALAQSIPGARLTDGYPVTPSPHFPGTRARFIQALLAIFEDDAYDDQGKVCTAPTALPARAGSPWRRLRCGR